MHLIPLLELKDTHTTCIWRGTLNANTTSVCEQENSTGCLLDS